MSLLDSFKKKAVDSVASGELDLDDWAATGFDALLDKAGELLPSGGDVGEVAASAAGTAALRTIRAKKAVMARLGKHGLRSTIAMVAMGSYDAAAQHAALVSLKRRGTWDEVTTAIRMTSEAGNQAKRDLDAAHEEFTSTLKAIGINAARAALPLLIGAL